MSRIKSILQLISQEKVILKVKCFLLLIL